MGFLSKKCAEQKKKMKDAAKGKKKKRKVVIVFENYVSNAVEVRENLSRNFFQSWAYQTWVCYKKTDEWMHVWNRDESQAGGRQTQALLSWSPVAPSTRTLHLFLFLLQMPLLQSFTRGLTAPSQEVMEGKSKAPAVSSQAEGFLQESPLFRCSLVRASEYPCFPRGHRDPSAMLSSWVGTHLHKWAAIIISTITVVCSNLF